MQKGLGIKIIVINEPANTHVASNSPSFSDSLIIKYKYFLKNLWRYYIDSKNFNKKQKINISDKKINISILSFINKHGLKETMFKR